MRSAFEGRARPASFSANFLTVSRAGILASPSLSRVTSVGAVFGGHGPERDGVPHRIYRRNTVLSNLPRLARHHVERLRLGFEREAIPLRIRFAAKPEFACRGE